MNHKLDNDQQVSRKCTFPGCDRRFQAKGYCKAHHWQMMRGRGMTPINATRRPAGSPPRIITDEVACSIPGISGHCHVFRGAKTSAGYGEVSVGGKPILVHRYVWELEFGPIPSGFEIDHQCRNRACTNTDHLRLVTHRVNMTENILRHSSPPQCPAGHAYDESNTYKKPGRARRCRKCMREQQRRRRSKIA